MTFSKEQRCDILFSTSLSTSKKLVIPVERIGLVYTCIYVYNQMTFLIFEQVVTNCAVHMDVYKQASPCGANAGT